MSVVTKVVGGVRSLLLVPLYFLSFMMPKNRSLWLFGAWMGRRYVDNTRFVYQYVRQNPGTGIRPVWITASPELLAEMKADGHEVYLSRSLAGIWMQMRAGVVLFTHSVTLDFFGPAITRRAIRVELWHGSPLKKIMFDNNYNPRLQGVLARIYDMFPWYRNDGADYVSAPSEEVARNFRTAFRTPNVYVDGFPRNDGIAIGEPVAGPQDVRHCIYMPTFRGEFDAASSSVATDNFLKSAGFDVARLDAFFTERGMTLTLRLHPTNMPGEEIRRQLEAAKSLRIDRSADIYDSINQYDLLITDYSSIFFDYCLTGRPILFAPFDLDDYMKNSRQLYYDYMTICLTPQIRAWGDVLAEIDRVRATGLGEDYLGRYTAFRDKFNYFKDNDSSRRVFEAIRRKAAA